MEEEIVLVLVMIKIEEEMGLVHSLVGRGV
jgi:hypothetical protein